MKSYIKNLDLDKALKLINSLDSTDPELLILKSIIYIQIGRYQESLDLALNVLKTATISQDLVLEGKSRSNISYALWWMGQTQELEGFITETEMRMAHFSEDVSDKTLQHWRAFLLNCKGLLLWRLGDHTTALDLLQLSLKVAADLNNRQYHALTLYIIGIIYQSQGKIDKSISQLRESLEVYESFDYLLGIIFAKTSLGISYYSMGELQHALDLFQETLQPHHALGNPHFSAYAYDNIGMVYNEMNQTDLASEYLTKALKIRREVGNDFDTSITLYNFIINTTRGGKIEQTKSFVEELKLIAEINDNMLLTLRAKLGEALYYKSQSGLQNIVTAKNLLHEIINERVYNFDLTLYAMIHYCELLFLELQINQSTAVIEDIKQLLFGMETLASQFQSYSLMVEVLILRAKLSLIEDDLVTAHNHLEQAQIMTEELGLDYLENKVERELQNLKSTFLQWHDLVNSNAGMLEKIETTSVIDYLSSLSRINLNANVPEQFEKVFTQK